MPTSLNVRQARELSERRLAELADPKFATNAQIELVRKHGTLSALDHTRLTLWLRGHVLAASKRVGPTSAVLNGACINEVLNALGWDKTRRSIDGYLLTREVRWDEELARAVEADKDRDAGIVSALGLGELL